MGQIFGKIWPHFSRNMISIFAEAHPLPEIRIIVRVLISYLSKATIYFFSLDFGYSPCLASRLNDYGQAHSPIYGFSLDGFPIYGPYQASGVLAVSCWQPRNFDKTSPTGCSLTGTRSCVLKNPLNYALGTTNVFNGPSTSSIITSASGNSIAAVSGVFKQDYFFNAS
jgi:hypothetical protein